MYVLFLGQVPFRKSHTFLCALKRIWKKLTLRPADDNVNVNGYKSCIELIYDLKRMEKKQLGKMEYVK